MSVYESRLTADKNEIRRRASDAGQRVRAAVSAAVEALLARDEQRCSEVMIGDQAINREIRAIDKLCHAFVARHLPSAGHLRFVSSVLRMNVALERIGDYAVTIAREGAQLHAVPPANLAEEMRSLSSQSTAVLEQSLKAFADRDANLARKTKPEAKSVGKNYAAAFRDLVREATHLSTEDSFALLTVFHRLDRVNDQAKNICEETLFELTGEVKPTKRFRILFVGTGDTLVAPLAVALSRKAFPDSGDYSSAGYAPGAELAPELLKMADEYSFDLSALAPRPLDKGIDALQRFHVIVCLSRQAREKISAVPYGTAVVIWDLPHVSEAPSTESASRAYELGRTLSHEIRELMVRLSGEEAG